MALDHLDRQTQNRILARLRVAGATPGPSIGAGHEDFLVKLDPTGKIDRSFLPDSVLEALNGVNFLNNAAFQSGALAPVLGALVGTWAISAGTPSISNSGPGSPLHGATQLEMAVTEAVAQRARIISEVPTLEQAPYVFSLYAEGSAITAQINVTIDGEDDAGTVIEPGLINSTFVVPFGTGKTRFEFPFSITPGAYVGGDGASAIVITLTAITDSISVDCTKLEVGTIASKWTPDTSFATVDEMGEVLLAALGDATNIEGNRVVQTDDPRLLPSGVVYAGTNFIINSAFQSGPGTLASALGSLVGVWAEAVGTPPIAPGGIDDSVHGAYVVALSATDAIEIRVRVLVSEDLTYVLSFYGIAAAPGVTVDVDITLEDSSQITRQTIPTVNFAITDSVWNRESMSFTVDNSLFPGSLAPTYAVIHISSSTGNAEIDAFKLEVGSTPTDWVPDTSWAKVNEVGEVLLAPLGDATNAEGNRVVQTDDPRLVAGAGTGTSTNFMPNSGLEVPNLLAAGPLPPVGFWQQTVPTTAVIAPPVLLPPLHASNVLQLVAGSSGDTVQIFLRLPSEVAPPDQPTAYVFSFYSNTAAPTSAFTATVEGWDDTFSPVELLVPPAPTPSTVGLWTRHFYPFAITPAAYGGPPAATYLRIEIARADPDPTPMEFDAFQLEFGVTPTPWKPGRIYASTEELGEVVLAPLGSAANPEGNRVVQTDDPRLLGGGGGATLDQSQVKLTALTTTLDGDKATNTTVAAPAPGMILVFVNRVSASIGDGTTVGVDCYFTDPTLTTPRSFGNIVAGDIMRWAGSNAGYQLSPSDEIDWYYES